MILTGCFLFLLAVRLTRHEQSAPALGGAPEQTAGKGFICALRCTAGYWTRWGHFCKYCQVGEGGSVSPHSNDSMIACSMLLEFTYSANFHCLRFFCSLFCRKYPHHNLQNIKESIKQELMVGRYPPTSIYH